MGITSLCLLLNFLYCGYDSSSLYSSRLDFFSSLMFNSQSLNIEYPEKQHARLLWYTINKTTTTTTKTKREKQQQQKKHPLTWRTRADIHRLRFGGSAGPGGLRRPDLLEASDMRLLLLDGSRQSHGPTFDLSLAISSRHLQGNWQGKLSREVFIRKC